MPLSDASSRGSREAEKVQAWYAEAKQRTAGGEDASKLLMASLAADIQREIQQASSRLKRGSDASSRLYQDAQRRAHKAASATASELSAVSLVQHASALSFEERSAVQARNTELLAEMESRKQSEVRQRSARVLGPPARRRLSHSSPPGVAPRLAPKTCIPPRVPIPGPHPTRPTSASLG